MDGKAKEIHDQFSRSRMSLLQGNLTSFTMALKDHGASDSTCCIMWSTAVSEHGWKILYSWTHNLSAMNCIVSASYNVVWKQISLQLYGPIAFRELPNILELENWIWKIARYYWHICTQRHWDSTCILSEEQGIRSPKLLQSCHTKQCTRILPFVTVDLRSVSSMLHMSELLADAKIFPKNCRQPS